MPTHCRMNRLNVRKESITMATCLKRFGLLLLALSMVPLASEAQQPKAKSKEGDSLPGIIVVDYKSQESGGNAVVLKNVETRKLGERNFIVGKVAFLGEQHEFEGRPMWIPVDQVT